MRIWALVLPTALLWLVVANTPLPNQQYFSKANGSVSQCDRWATSAAGDPSRCAPGCALWGDQQMDISHAIETDCDAYACYGNAHLSVLEGGVFVVNENMEVYGDAQLTVSEGASLIIHGDLRISGNAQFVLDGSLVISGSVFVEGQATMCGHGSAQVSGRVGGAGICGTVGITRTPSMEITTAHGTNNTLAIVWKTLTRHVGGTGYLVEGSANGMTFNEIGRVPASNREQYQYICGDQDAQQTYYRITLLDQEQRAIASELVSQPSAAHNTPSCSLHLNPVPCSPWCEGRIKNCPNGGFACTVLDIRGQSITQHLPEFEVGNALQYFIDRENFLAPGVYILQNDSSTEIPDKKGIVK